MADTTKGDESMLIEIAPCVASVVDSNTNPKHRTLGAINEGDRSC